MERLDDGYRQLFDPKVFDRGQAYYDAGKVDPPAEITDGLWHAVVRGTEDYQVDVRLRHGKVISAACTCPYGQRVTYCKHVAGVLISLEKSFRRGDDETDTFPHEASSCVDWYLMKEFPTRKRLKEMDWRTVRILLERLYCPQDLEGMMRHAGLKSLGAGHDDPADGSANMRLLVPGTTPTRLNELPHVWLTVLEAAYEHLHDEKGLRRLYAFYILIAQTDPEAVYVERLRRVSGRHWDEDRDLIVRMHERRDRFPSWAPVNPAYERLLREERLPDAAFRYVGTKSGDMTVRMLDVIALSPECAQQAERRLRETLCDPDSVLYESDTKESAERVGRWIRKIESVYGFDAACEISAEVVGMFPRRKALLGKLSEYIAERGDPAETAPSESPRMASEGD